jgi:hypothetical protein
VTLAATLLAGALALMWALALFLGIRALRSMKRLEDTTLLPESEWPLVTMLVPARDEGRTLEAALRSKLAVDYPRLEVIVIDDRSTDATGTIASGFASRDARIRVLRIDELPEGWLGKIHALDRGMCEARGEWVLMSDADVSFSPSALRRAVSFATDADFLALIPHFEHVSFAVDALMHDFLRSVLPFVHADQIADPKSPRAVGGGVFNLVRRSAYERTPGFPWLRIEVGDDVAFGQMMKRSGARCRVANGSRDVRVLLHSSVKDFFRGIGKGVWPVVARFSVTRLVLVCASIFFLHAAPFALLTFPSLPVRILAGTALLCSAGGAVAPAVVTGRRVGPAIFAPLAGLVSATAMLVVGLGQWMRGGITWRRTFYPTAVLRAGQRLVPPWKL